MLEKLGKKIKNWINPRLSFASLVLSIFFTSYFPAINRYSFNYLFNEKTKGFFGFLVSDLYLKKSDDDENWIWKFALLIFLSSFLAWFFKSSSKFFTRLSKKNLKEIVDRDFHTNKETEWTKSFSDKIINDFSSFFSPFCELFIEIWATISINMKRHMDIWTILKSSLCLMLIFSTIIIMKNYVERKKLKDRSYLSFFSVELREKIVSLEPSGSVFTALFLLFFAKNNSVVTAVLLGFNVSAILSKLKELRKVFPETISTYKMWKETRRLYNVKHFLIQNN